MSKSSLPATSSSAPLFLSLPDRLAALADEISLTSCEVDPEIYSAASKVLPPNATEYSSFCSLFCEYGAALERQDKDIRCLYNRYLVCWLLLQFNEAESVLALPESVFSLYPGQLSRIERQLDDMRPEFYSLLNDAFIKDVAILTHRLVPVGAEFAFPGGGVPRSVLWRSGLSGLGGLIRCLLFSGGFKPFLALHMHKLDTVNFNADGWMETYDRLADLLECNPRYRGIQSTSWFLDPALDAISPHLTYLRKVPEDSGARMFFMEVDRAGVSGALSKSARRRQLFDQGMYVPALYMRIWPRRLLLQRQWHSRRE